MLAWYITLSVVIGALGAVVCYERQDTLSKRLAGGCAIAVIWPGIVAVGFWESGVRIYWFLWRLRHR